MRIAFFSPLPPAKTGIADYSAALLAAMRTMAEVEVFESAPRDFEPGSYDILLYQLGNNCWHEGAYRAALRFPGVVVLHEPNLHHLIAEITIKRGDWEGYFEEVRYEGGEEALAYARRVKALEVGPDYDGLPMIRRLLERARGIIVHSRFVEAAVRRMGYAGPVAVVPHGAWILETDRMGYRQRLGLAPSTPLIGIFGFLKPYKRIPESLRAFRRLLRLDNRARMILVGEPHPDLPLEQLIGSLGLQEAVRLLGFVAPEDFVGYMAACDIVLNLRYPTLGESSGTLLRALGLGKAVIVSDVGSFSECPDEICLKVPPGEGEQDLLFEYLNLLVSRPELAACLGKRARRWVERECSWERAARLYCAFFEAVRNGGTTVSPAPSTVVGARRLELPDSVTPAPPVVKSQPPSPAPLTETAEATSGAIDPAPPATEVSIPVAPYSVEAHVSASVSARPEADPSEEESTSAREFAALRWSTLEPDEPAAGDPQEDCAEEELAHWLMGWIQEEAARRYLEDHLTRLLHTLRITPPGSASDRILEMGAYLQMTPALKLRLGYGEVRGCYYGQAGRVDEKRVVSESGEEFTCLIDVFDAERDRFPYPDEWFTTVLCCELVEHLKEDPMHMMSEINRILKPGGHLVLTTPNIASLRAISAILQGYHPGFFPAYLKPGPDGGDEARHNREYTPREVHHLLYYAGFEVALLETGEFRKQPHPEHYWVKHLLRAYRLPEDLRGDGIYAVGRKTGPVRERFPEWLYSGGAE